MPAASPSQGLVLPDASAWIDLIEGNPTWQARRLRELLDLRLVVVGDLVAMEVLRGVRDDLRMRRLAKDFEKLPNVLLVEQGTALRAAHHYRYLRSLGITVRSTVDCLIGTYCIDHQLPLLHADRDFDAFRDHLGLIVVDA